MFTPTGGIKRPHYTNTNKNQQDQLTATAALHCPAGLHTLATYSRGNVVKPSPALPSLAYRCRAQSCAHE